MRFTRRWIAFGLVALPACATIGVDDPIVGVWNTESGRWIFRSDHTAVPHPDDAAGADQIATVIYPRIQWQKIGSNLYALLYWRSWLSAHERQERVEVRLRGSELQRLSDGAATFTRS